MAKIVIIDSGISSSHNIFNDIEYKGIHFFNENGNIIYDYNIEDYFGHGTAVASIIRKNSEVMTQCELWTDKVMEEDKVMSFARSKVNKSEQQGIMMVAEKSNKYI